MQICLRISLDIRIGCTAVYPYAAKQNNTYQIDTKKAAYANR